MLVQVFPVMLIELIICTCQTSRITYFLALNVLWSILETLYTSYYAIGLLAYSLALISYLPFIVSLVRMACRDTETRRMIFYRACWRLWLFTLFIDLWTFVTIEANVDELCEHTGFMPDQRIIATHFGVHSIHIDTMIILCHVRLHLHRFSNLTVYHMQYLGLLYVSKLHWYSKRSKRIKEERRFTERLLSRELTAQDWSRAMLSLRSIELLVGQLCPYRMTILGAVLIDKEIAESINYVSLSAKLRGQSRDARLLRILFESRIKQRVA
mmetsp:Transcript_2387/g.3032  ORF Transcript_2387/g.3032 Transcript_2387/m.3032 type:complete len:269 (+) Transcript_2387:111-917(+)